MIRLSAVIITFNEEKNIERCIQSLLPVADEVLVVDSFSSDTTREKAANLGARVLEHAFEGHIQQKNWAASEAKYDFVLSLDADEALTDELRDSILKVKANWVGEGYRVKRLTNYCGQWIKHCGWYPDMKLRLFDRRLGAWGGTNPHDKYELKSGNAGAILKGDLLHYSFYSIRQHVDTVNSFSSIKAQVDFDRNKKPSYLKMIFGPVIRFLRDYVMKLGFLDGFYGFVICINNAHSVFLKQVKLAQLHKDRKTQ